MEVEVLGAKVMDSRRRGGWGFGAAAQPRGGRGEEGEEEEEEGKEEKQEEAEEAGYL